MDALLRVTRSVTRHRQLVAGSLGRMGCLPGYRDGNVHLTRQTDSYQAVRVGSEVFPGDSGTVAHITVTDKCRVEVELAMIATDQSLVQIPDVQRAKGLKVLGVGPLHMKLQLIGLGIILGIEGFTNLGNPLVGILVEVAVHWLSRPEGDVVEVNHVVLNASINQRS